MQELICGRFVGKVHGQNLLLKLEREHFGDDLILCAKNKKWTTIDYNEKHASVRLDYGFDWSAQKI